MTDRVNIGQLLENIEANDGCSIMNVFSGMGLQDQLKAINDMDKANKNPNIRIGFDVDGAGGNLGNHMSMDAIAWKVEKLFNGDPWKPEASFLGKFSARPSSVDFNYYCTTSESDKFTVGRRTESYLNGNVLEDNHTYKSREEYNQSGDQYLWARGRAKP